jgi:hypothetical protein
MVLVSVFRDTSDLARRRELNETIQLCEEPQMEDALSALQGEWGYAEFRELAGGCIGTAVLPYEAGDEDVPILVLAVGVRSEVAVRFLLAAGCDPNARSSQSGATALHIAACLWNFNLVKILVECVPLPLPTTHPPHSGWARARAGARARSVELS